MDDDTKIYFNISCLLWTRKVHYTIKKFPQLVFIVRYVNLVNIVKSYFFNTDFILNLSSTFSGFPINV